MFSSGTSERPEKPPSQTVRDVFRGFLTSLRIPRERYTTPSGAAKGDARCAPSSDSRADRRGREKRRHRRRQWAALASSRRYAALSHADHWTLDHHGPQDVGIHRQAAARAGRTSSSRASAISTRPGRRLPALSMLRLPPQSCPSRCSSSAAKHCIAKPCLWRADFTSQRSSEISRGMRVFLVTLAAHGAKPCANCGPRTARGASTLRLPPTRGLRIVS